ncbi:MAG: hypothetical protein ACRERC_14465 [Candidatus Binatia bacterium]
MNAMRTFLLAMATTLVLGTAGCEENKGPAERAGEKIDDAVDRAGDAVEDAGDKLEDATDQ